MLCAECTELRETGPGASGGHLSWEKLRAALPPVPRILLAHLGEEARAGIPRDAGVVVCDDLTFIDL